MKQLCKILYIGLCLMTFHKTIIFSDGLAIGCIKRGTHTCKKTAIVPKADGTVKTTKYLIAHQDITHICNILMVCLSWAFSLANGWLRLVAGCCRITVDCCNAEIGNFLYLCSRNATDYRKSQQICSIVWTSRNRGEARNNNF